MKSQLGIELIAFLVLFGGTATVILLVFQGGLRLGRWRSAQPDPEPQLPARMIISSVLGLLSFVLGFTFGLGTSHHDARNQALSNEIIAIRTAYHRSGLLPEPRRSNVRDLLRQYVDLRIERIADVDDWLAQIRRMQERIWTEAIGPEDSSTGGQPPSLLIQSLNEVIDVNGERVLINMRSRIAPWIWIILYGITFVAVAAAGYQSGLGGAHRRSIAAVAYALVFSAVITMIVDSDFPGFGQLQTDRTGLIELRQQLNSDAAAAYHTPDRSR